MFKNYITTALRNIYKNKLFSLINIGGLAIAFAASMLIALFITYEASYDTWVPNADNIYRMDLAYFNSNGSEGLEGQQGVTSGPLKAALEKDFSEIDQVTRIVTFGSTIQRGEETFLEYYSAVDKNFFNVFKFTFISGNPETALLNPNSMVLSETLAKKYFGDENPVGKTMETAAGTILNVTGVYEDFPQNTEVLNVGDMIYYLDEEKYGTSPWLGSWGTNSLGTFFTLKEGGSIDNITPRLGDFLDQNKPWGTENKRPSDGEYLVPLLLTDIHLYGTTGDDSRPGGGAKVVMFFGVIALLILAIAGFNYLNSSTAMASLRAKEISMRKVVGAGRNQLVRQFLGESLLITFLAFLLSMVIVELSLHWMDAFLDRPISANFWQGYTLAAYAFLLVPIIGFGAGIYPAFFLSRYKPNQIFMDKQINKTGGFTARSLLVMLQFAASIGLIIVTMAVKSQHTYSISGDLGYQSKNKIILRGVETDYVQEKMQILEGRFKNLPGVKSVTESFSFPSAGVTDNSPVTLPGRIEDSLSFISHSVGFDYFETYGIQLKAGRTFSPDHATDKIISPVGDASEQITTGAAVVNETAVKDLGFSTFDQALGQTVRLDLEDGTGWLDLTIVGVVTDFKELTTRQKVPPSIYFNRQSDFRFMTLSLEEGYYPEIRDQIDEIWNTMLPNQMMSYWYLEDFLRDTYQATETQAMLLTIFSGLAIIISCLGLYGLASFAALRRTKEIGIRKVFGATVPNIILMMIKQFSNPVILANLVAWPIAWIYLDSWLAAFAYHISLSPGFFISSGFASLLIAWLAVGGSAFKVAINNPIKALKYE